jgi:Protein of unknown function (DUF3987)
MSPPDNAGAAQVRAIIETADEMKPEPPRPLMRELPPADPFPVDALGDVLAPAARAIHDRVQAPLAICGQSVLAAATLAVQGHADVELPTRQIKPLTNFYITIAATGERKTAVDTEALCPVRKREAALRDNHDAARLDYHNAKTAWEKARDAAIKSAKGDRGRIKALLDVLGPAPLPPLEPLLTCPEPTYEGLCKLFAVGWPSLGIFASEGGQFIGGHGLSEDAKLRTAAGLSAAWDGEPIKRVRGGDGVIVLPGRRLAMHLMAQPDVASALTNDRLLAEQGILSRCLATAPGAASGTRMWHEPSPESDTSIKRYGGCLLQILEKPLPLAPDTQNTLSPRILPLAPHAAGIWKRFYNHIERRVAPGDELEPVRGLANKLPEHAVRLAAVLTLVQDIDAGDVGADALAAGIELAQHYAAEALRLSGASGISGKLRDAQRLLRWLHSLPEPLVSLPDIYQRGPNAIRDKATASDLVQLLSDHGHLIPITQGAMIAGHHRREVWRIVKV